MAGLLAAGTLAEELPAGSQAEARRVGSRRPAEALEARASAVERAEAAPEARAVEVWSAAQVGQTNGPRSSSPGAAVPALPSM